MLILLAGPAAERLAPVLMPDGYLATSPCDARAAKQVARLSARDRLFLSRGDECDPDPACSDETKAVEDAHLLAPEAAGHLLEHMRCEAFRLTVMTRFQRLLAALVPAVNRRVVAFLEIAEQPTCGDARMPTPVLSRDQHRQVERVREVERR
jgi:hypothetical protein